MNLGYGLQYVCTVNSDAVPSEVFYAVEGKILHDPGYDANRSDAHRLLQRTSCAVHLGIRNWGESGSLLRSPGRIRTRKLQKRKFRDDRGAGDALWNQSVAIWLPGMDSNHELDKILKSHKLLILQSR